MLGGDNPVWQSYAGCVRSGRAPITNALPHTPAPPSHPTPAPSFPGRCVGSGWQPRPASVPSCAAAGAPARPLRWGLIRDLGRVLHPFEDRLHASPVLYPKGSPPYSLCQSPPRHGVHPDYGCQHPPGRRGPRLDYRAPTHHPSNAGSRAMPGHTPCTACEPAPSPGDGL